MLSRDKKNFLFRFSWW